MIIKESKLSIVDNSGGLVGKCFHIFGRKEAKIGSKIVISIQTFKTGKKVTKGEIFFGILVQTRKIFYRKIGMYYKFIKNAVVLWKRKEDGPVGTRVKCYVPMELRFLGFVKIIMVSLGTF